MADSQIAMFDATPYEIEPLAPEPKLSPDRARTVRQAAALAAGRHPLQPIVGCHLPLHPEAAPHDDRKAPGRRCGDCRFRELLEHHDKSWPKCMHGRGGRATHSAASDVRAWWPACRDHAPRDGAR